MFECTHYDFKRMGNNYPNKKYVYTNAAFRGCVYGILYISPIINLFIISIYEIIYDTYGCIANSLVVFPSVIAKH